VIALKAFSASLLSIEILRIAQFSVVSQKSLSFACHSGLDPESSVLSWIPAFAGMTPSELM
jgi:hypothetical protein